MTRVALKNWSEMEFVTISSTIYNAILTMETAVEGSQFTPIACFVNVDQVKLFRVVKMLLQLMQARPILQLFQLHKDKINELHLLLHFCHVTSSRKSVEKQYKVCLR